MIKHDLAHEKILERIKLSYLAELQCTWQAKYLFALHDNMFWLTSVLLSHFLLIRSLVSAETNTRRRDGGRGSCVTSHVTDFHTTSSLADPTEDFKLWFKQFEL